MNSSNQKFKKNKKHGTVGHCFHSCANKETTDHCSQSRCASKNPWATLCTAALPIRIHVSLIRTAVLQIAASMIYLCMFMFKCFHFKNIAVFFRNRICPCCAKSCNIHVCECVCSREREYCCICVYDQPAFPVCAV